MYNLEKPQRIDKSFNITSVVEKALVQNDMAPDTEEHYIEVSGYASRMYMDGKFVIDADQEHVNTFGFDLKRLQSGIMPLLFNHKQDKPVGKITEATYDADGLLIKAKIFKYPDDNLTNFVYHSVKNGVISAFSVGMLVKNFDVVTQDGNDYLQLSESEVIEVSLVAVPSNPEALFRVTNLKSATGEDKLVTLLEKSVLKAENAEVCNGFECVIKAQKEKQIHEVEELQKERIMEVTEKNPEIIEEKEVILGVTPEGEQAIAEILNVEDTPAQVEDTTPAEGETIKPADTQESEIDKVNDKPSEEPQVELEPTKEDMIHNELSAISNMNIAELSDDELERVYEALAPVVEKIEERVAQMIIEEARSLMTVTAPAE